MIMPPVGKFPEMHAPDAHSDILARSHMDADGNLSYAYEWSGSSNLVLISVALLNQMTSGLEDYDVERLDDWVIRIGDLRVKIVGIDTFQELFITERVITEAMAKPS